MLAPMAGNRAGTSFQRVEPMAAVEAYSALAPHYSSYAQTRSLYLRKVEEIVIAQTGAAAAVLDVGAGDGSRSLRIARGVSATRLVLIEPSAGMRAVCPKDAEIWPCSAEQLPQFAPQFDLVLSLWNVLGHIPSAQDRVRALSRLKEAAAPGGTIFLDVNHRHNAAAYGWTRTFSRIACDFFFPADENGDVMVSWQAGDSVVQTQGHVFTKAEMQKLIRLAGLKVKRRWVINYETGAECRLPFMGQLLYQLAAA
jgi:SAM-dependent methyltransferase